MTNRIDDERVVFYLRHQHLIDTWAAVRKDVVESANDFYASLAEDLAEVASEQGEDLEVWANDGNYSRVGLYRRSWLVDGTAHLVACLEWHRQSTFVEGERHVGVIFRKREPAVEGLRQEVEEEIRDVRGPRGFPKSSQFWPAYRQAPGPVGGTYWEDLSDYRADLVSGIVSALESFSEEFEQALSVWRSSHPPT